MLPFFIGTQEGNSALSIHRAKLSARRTMLALSTLLVYPRVRRVAKGYSFMKHPSVGVVKYLERK
jgi:hypothetical protein